jgi:hypothetical protein
VQKPHLRIYVSPRAALCAKPPLWERDAGKVGRDSVSAGEGGRPQLAVLHILVAAARKRNGDTAMRP